MTNSERERNVSPLKTSKEIPFSQGRFYYSTAFFFCKILVSQSKTPKNAFMRVKIRVKQQ